MSGTPTRVAVQVGRAAVRIAGAEADGEPWLIAELSAPAAGVADLLADLVGAAPDELLLIHPGSWPASRTAVWAHRCRGLARRVRTVPAPLAAAGPGARVVLDVGHAGAEATRLAADGRVLASRTHPVAGAFLDDVLLKWLGAPATTDARSEVRRVREALSLLPAVPTSLAGRPAVAAEEVRPVLAGALRPAVDLLRSVRAPDGTGPVLPVLLVGGVARAPLLAELVDEAGIVGAVVAPRPETAAVLGALALPTAAGTRLPADAHPPSAPGPPLRLPPLPTRKRRPVRAILLTTAAAGVAALLVAVGVQLSPSPVAVPSGVLVQYGYRLAIPTGWEHTGGLPERRRSVLTPVTAPDGGDLIAVERSPLGYDADAEPDRARAELRAEFDAAVAAGSTLTDYDTDARSAGRPVVAYRQREGRLIVDWFVLLDGDSQLSVGCRHTAPGAPAVGAACGVVVESVRRG